MGLACFALFRFAGEPLLGKKETLYRVFKVSPGWCAAVRGSGGVLAVVLPVETREGAERAIRSKCPGAKGSRSAMRKLVTAIRRYFNGWRTEFNEFQLDLSSGTLFQQRVWAVTRRIPYGQVRTYRWIGMEIGRPKAVRAIGGALGANPVPLIVPCHRVVNADGSLGGFSAEGGVELKAGMLELERVRMVGEGADRRVMASSARGTG